MEEFRNHVARLWPLKFDSQAKFIHAAGHYNGRGASPETIRNVVTGRKGDQLPTEMQLMAICAALEVEPEEFAVYRIIQARRLLDPAVVGFDQAMVNATALAKFDQAAEDVGDLVDAYEDVTSAAPTGDRPRA